MNVAFDWTDVGTLFNDPEPMRHKKGSMSKQETVAGEGGGIGDERALAERWKKLLYAEARLQSQRDEILNLLEEQASSDAETYVDEVREKIRLVLEDQVRRPSPDFRALLLRTRKAILDGNTKEALRCTDVERLEEWPTPTIATIALRLVVDRLIEELSDGKENGVVCSTDWDTWVAETLRDLQEARERPDEYIARMTPNRDGPLEVNMRLENPDGSPVTAEDLAKDLSEHLGTDVEVKK